MHLTETTWPEAEAVDTDLAVVPIGSTEQHGPHAPLGTDEFAAAAVADGGATACNDEVIVAPPIPVSVAEEHRHFAGTLWVSEDTFRDYVRETVESLASHGWDRVVLVNGHGGNAAPLREVCSRLVRDGDAYAVPFTWFESIGDVIPRGMRMGHGGPIETSLVRHLHPELVDEEEFENARENGSERWGEFHGSTNLAFDTNEFSESGAVGDPAESSEDLGERMLNRASQRLAHLLTVIADRDL